jgi:hypothetical protein
MRRKFNQSAPILLSLVLESIVHLKKLCCRDDSIEPDIELACTSCTKLSRCPKALQGWRDSWIWSLGFGAFGAIAPRIDRQAAG